jgi:hypothetical protein
LSIDQGSDLGATLLSFLVNFTLDLLSGGLELPSLDVVLLLKVSFELIFSHGKSLALSFKLLSLLKESLEFFLFLGGDILVFEVRSIERSDLFSLVNYGQ